MTLWGRRQQCEAIDGLLAEVWAGRSRALVLRGEPGIGKTALLGYAADTAPDFRVAVGIITPSDLTRWLHRWRVLGGRALDSRAR